ncbi:MAG: flagellar basal body P-ring formation chaperone FlgA [Proteobacteria bacterium]|nr:flagellar basal body P-ring formation chaperone FlgA [Pseudomonadota bacterium]
MSRALRIALGLGLLLTPAAPAVAETVVERVGAAIRQHLASEAKQPLRAVELPALHGFEQAGAGPVEVAVSTRPGQAIEGRVPVRVVLRREGRELKRAIVHAHVRVDVAVFVAARALPRGHVVQSGDVVRAVRDASKVRPGAVTSPDAVVGSRLRVALRAGRVWEARFVERVPVVARGQTVALQFESGALRIEGRGRVRENGHAGDLVQVTPLGSLRTVAGRVDAAGVVHVGR